jgi:hypothetical protein
VLLVLYYSLGVYVYAYSFWRESTVRFHGGISKRWLHIHTTELLIN